MTKQGNINTFNVEIYSESPHKKYSTNKTIIKYIDETWNMDILDLNDYGLENNRGLDLF